MKRLGIIFIGLLSFLFFNTLSIAKNIPPTERSTHVLANVKIRYADNIITLTNQSKEAINLQNATLQFHYSGKVAEIIALNNLKIKAAIAMREYAQQPLSAGNFYQITFTDINQPKLMPGQSLQLKMTADNRNAPHGLQLLLVDRVPVLVKVTTANNNWVETISICNISTNAIPLTDVELDFNYGITMPTNIWGQPWAAWHVGSQQGQQVVLLGGTAWTPALPSDPNCAQPLTIQFNASPSDPQPSGPFVFKAAGGQPSGFGSIAITLQSAPASGVPNPQITVQGMNTTLQQVVNWGSQWVLNNLVPGSYTITAVPVDNGQQFFQAPALNVNVTDQGTTPALVKYQPVPSGQVVVTLVNAPAAQEPVTFSGQTYTIKQLVPTNTTLTLPADTYTVTSLVPGFSATATPNPLVVPTNSTLAITYQQSATARFVGYFQSWSPDPQTTDGTKTNLANLPPYVNVVNLAFMRPDAVYLKGSMTFNNTGLEFNYQNGAVLKQAISTLHQKNPGTKVLVAVGGATFTNWGSLNAKAIADFVTDFGLDGVDIDYEPAATGCALGTDNQIHCQIDAAFAGFVQSLRSVLPRPTWITVTGFSVGAFGQDQWKTAQPQSQYTGMMLPLLRSPAAKDIDMVNVMSFDAGTTFDPIQALAAYSFYYPGPISMGVEVPPEACCGHVYTLCQVSQLVQAVKTSAAQHNNTPPGMMIWSIQKAPNGAPTPSNPNAQMMATTICTSLGLPNCNQPLLANGFAASIAGIDFKNLCI